LERMPGEAGFGGSAMDGVCPGRGWIAVDLVSVCGRLPWVVTGMPWGNRFAKPFWHAAPTAVFLDRCWDGLGGCGFAVDT
jgi:hypothetical protein